MRRPPIDIRKHLRLTLLAAVASVVAVACGGDSPGVTLVDTASVITGVSISAPQKSILVGGTTQLWATPVNVAGVPVTTGKTIQWSSSRPDIATVSDQGIVTGVSLGTTIITAASAGESGTLAISVQAPTNISLTSDKGDWIGQGLSYAYTSSDAVIRASATASTITVSVRGKQNWDATFIVPRGAQLEAKTYANALGYPFQGINAGLGWSGENRGCSGVIGSFTIDSIAWTNGVGSSLFALDMHFDQHCDQGTPALRGTIHWRSDDTASPPPPSSGTPPANMWTPPAGAVPATGDYVYFESEPGDYVGLGETKLFLTGIDFRGHNDTVHVAVGGYDASFLGKNSSPSLLVGYYGNLTRYPFSDPRLGGLSVFANGHGCNQLSGWFNVDRVSYDNVGMVKGIELRFEQHCEGATPALHGAIRWGQF